MPKKIKGWNTTCNRFVAFLDIMGFRERVFRESHDDVKKMLESLRQPIGTIEQNAKKPLVMHVVKSQEKGDVISTPSVIIPVTFSDSIILITNDKSDISAMFLFAYVGWILRVAFEKEIPIKGAIAYGEMTADIDNSLYFGKPLIDAFELHQELQLYGVILHYTCQRRLDEINSFKNTGTIKQYPVPMKSGNITHNIIDWDIFTDMGKDPGELVGHLYNTVSGKPRIYVDNTLKFINWLKEEKAKLAPKKPENPV